MIKLNILPFVSFRYRIALIAKDSYIIIKTLYFICDIIIISNNYVQLAQTPKASINILTLC
jgi:hypothetical protein